MIPIKFWNRKKESTVETMEGIKPKNGKGEGFCYHPRMFHYLKMSLRD
jgi:hypothetical protein